MLQLACSGLAPMASTGRSSHRSSGLENPPGRQMPSMQIQDPDRPPRNKIATCRGVAYVVGYSTTFELRSLHEPQPPWRT